VTPSTGRQGSSIADLADSTDNNYSGLLLSVLYMRTLSGNCPCRGLINSISYTSQRHVYTLWHDFSRLTAVNSCLSTAINYEACKLRVFGGQSVTLARPDRSTLCLEMHVEIFHFEIFQNFMRCCHIIPGRKNKMTLK